MSDIITVLGLGDSLTYGYGVRPGAGWFDRLSAHYPAINFYNRGVPGDSTAGMRRRFIRETLAPDIVTLWGGGNDILQGNGTAEILKNLSQIAEAAIARQARPILFLPLPVSRRPGPEAWVSAPEVDEVNGEFQALRAALSAYAARQVWRVFDPLTTLPAAGDLEAHFLADGIHLDESLHALIAQAFIASAYL
jgi:lysophospholipase L1-like esterase